MPLEQSRPWVAATRLEGGGQAPEQVVFDGSARPYAAKLKPRIIEPYSTRLAKNQLWVRSCWGDHRRNVMSPGYERSTTGDVIVVPEQKYSYGSAISLGENKAGLVPPQVRVRDGARNWGTLGYVGKLMLRRGGKGVYFLETDGRVGFMQFGAFSAPAGIDNSTNNVIGAKGHYRTWFSAF